MAREFSNTKRTDTFSPAAGCPTTNLIPLIYLARLGQLGSDFHDQETYGVTLAPLDVKDAFLQVPQERAFRSKLGQQHFAVLKKLQVP